MVLKSSAVMCVYNIQVVQILHKNILKKKCKKLNSQSVKMKHLN